MVLLQPWNVRSTLCIQQQTLRVFHFRNLSSSHAFQAMRWTTVRARSPHSVKPTRRGHFNQRTARVSNCELWLNKPIILCFFLSRGCRDRRFVECMRKPKYYVVSVRTAFRNAFMQCALFEWYLAIWLALQLSSSWVICLSAWLSGLGRAPLCACTTGERARVHLPGWRD